MPAPTITAINTKIDTRNVIKSVLLSSTGASALVEVVFLSTSLLSLKELTGVSFLTRSNGFIVNAGEVLSGYEAV